MNLETSQIIYYSKLPHCPDNQLSKSLKHRVALNDSTFIDPDAGYDLRVAQDYLVQPFSNLTPEIEEVTLHNVWVKVQSNFSNKALFLTTKPKNPAEYIFQDTCRFERKKWPMQLVPTGICIQPDFLGFFDIRPRSSTPKLGLGIANTPGTCDWGYSGELFINVWSMTNEIIPLVKGEAIAQIVPQILIPTYLKEGVLEDRKRNANGFGSTNPSPIPNL